MEAVLGSARARSDTGLSRRGVLLGAVAGLTSVAGAGWLVEEDVLPGRSGFYAALGLNGAGAPIPDAPPGRLVSGAFTSATRGGIEVGWTVSYPARSSTHARLPILLVLHGASGDHTTAFEEQALDRFLNLAIADGVEPFAIAAVDGGDDGWPDCTRCRSAL